MFYVVLAVVFVTNLVCLMYFGICGSHVTDFMEPQNLFPLSLNSPPSASLDGSCGGSLEKEQWNARWRIMRDKERDHWYFESRGSARKEERKSRHTQHTNFEMKSPIESASREHAHGRKRMSRL